MMWTFNHGLKKLYSSKMFMYFNKSLTKDIKIIQVIPKPRFIRGYNFLKCSVHHWKNISLIRIIQMTSLNQPSLILDNKRNKILK